MKDVCSKVCNDSYCKELILRATKVCAPCSQCLIVICFTSTFSWKHNYLCYQPSWRVWSHLEAVDSTTPNSKIIKRELGERVQGGDSPGRPIYIILDVNAIYGDYTNVMVVSDVKSHNADIYGLLHGMKWIRGALSLNKCTWIVVILADYPTQHFDEREKCSHMSSQKVVSGRALDGTSRRKALGVPVILFQVISKQTGIVLQG